MGNPVIQANQNLILNGDFLLPYTNGWLKQPPNSRGVVIGTEMYNGEMTRFLRISLDASVSQVIVAPKTLEADVGYVLSFLCEVRSGVAGRLVVAMADKPEIKQEIVLTPGSLRNEEQDRARLESGQPLEYLPKVYRVELDLPLQSQDQIRLTVHSPTGGGSNAEVRITRINLTLHLPAVKLQTLKLDEQVVPAGGLLPLCLGAIGNWRHRLECVPVAGHPWLGTQAALTLADNPQGAIRAEPDWGADQPLDEPWLLDCPLLDDEGPHLLTLQWVNQYTAEPYSIPVSLGHHRVVFREVLEAAYYPVLEYGQSVRLGVQVASYYTGQFLDGRTVSWTVAGQGVKGAALTDDDGWAYFDYVPTVAGDFDIEATVESLYYPSGVVSHTQTVRVLARDPWKTLQSVVESTETPWQEKTGYPNRGSGYALQVRLPADHLLSNSEMQLRWSGDAAEQLGVAVSPALETSVPVTGRDLEWTLTSEDRLDGRFELSLVCSKLLLPSPKKTMSLARNLVRIGEVREANKFPVVDENENVLLRVQVVHVRDGGDGDPVVNALVDWVTPEGALPTVPTGSGGWASLFYTPRNAGDQRVTARVRAHEEAVAYEHPFNVKALATSPWKSEVRILLDNVEVDRVVLGVLCWRGRSHTLKVEPLAGSTLIGQAIALNWRGAAPAIGLVASDIGTPRTLTAAGLEWTLSSVQATSVSSLFELKLSTSRLNADRELFGRLIATDLAEEASLALDQVAAIPGTQALYPCLGAVHRFSVLPNALSPLAGLSTTLSWTGATPEDLGASVTPPLAQPQVIDDGGARWSLDFAASPAPGRFALALALPQLNWTATANDMLLAHNRVRIGTWQEAAVDPVVGQEPAWLWAQVFSRYTGRAVEHVPLKWLAGAVPIDVQTDADGWSGFAFAPSGTGPQEVRAVLISPYDGYEESRAMTVSALASDPWSGVTVSFDDQPPQPWGAKTYFPRRSGNHKLQIMASHDSPLLDQQLTLGLTGTGPAALGIRFDPTNVLGTPLPISPAGVQLTFTVGDVQDGAFALRLAASRLAALSPANAMSLGSGVQVVKLRIDSRVAQTLNWGQTLVEQVTVVSSVSGKPMKGLTVTWRSPDLGVVTSVTDFYGVASVRFTPTTAGASVLTATVGDRTYSQSVSLAYAVNQPSSIQSLVCAEPAGYPGQVASGMATVVSAFTGEPLAGVEVMWDYSGVRLAPTLTGADGVATVEFTLEQAGEGLLTAFVSGGLYGWEMASVIVEVLPVHASIREVNASPNPAAPQVFVTMTAVIVATDTGQPLAGREVFVSVSGGAYRSTLTDAKGEVIGHWRPLMVGDLVSLNVEVRNPGEPAKRSGIVVPVI